jgi:hypothetical protein
LCAINILLQNLRTLALQLVNLKYFIVQIKQMDQTQVLQLSLIFSILRYCKTKSKISIGYAKTFPILWFNSIFANLIHLCICIWKHEIYKRYVSANHRLVQSCWVWNRSEKQLNFLSTSRITFLAILLTSHPVLCSGESRKYLGQDSHPGFLISSKRYNSSSGPLKEFL